MRLDELRDRIENGPPVLLDGALGTELERAGVESSLPLWTSHALMDAPDAVARVHARYADAGAEILTAGTFRTQRRTFERAGLAEPGRLAAELSRTAVALARSAGAGRGEPLVAGSAPPLEDCFRPDLAPPPDALAREHREHARHLAAAGADLILVETMNSVVEAAAAADAAAGTELPFLVAFACGADASLPSGEPLREGIDAVRASRPLAVLVNCTPPSALAPCVDVLVDCGLPFGVYPNLGEPTPTLSWSESASPDEFARLVCGVAARGATLVGGCCGTGPEHVRAIARVLADRA